MPRGTTSGNEPGLQSLQEVESSKGHRGDESCVMECVGNEVHKGWGRGGSGPIPLSPRILKPRRWSIDTPADEGKLKVIPPFCDPLNPVFHPLQDVHGTLGKQSLRWCYFSGSPESRRQLPFLLLMTLKCDGHQH